jgi:hypothetical protein
MLELRGGGPALLDEPLAFEVRGAPPETPLSWRARVRDDDGIVWTARADSAHELVDAPWRGGGRVAAMSSLRHVLLGVRAEAPEGAAVARELDRHVVGSGVRVRRWREDGLAATLFRPEATPSATALVGGGAPAAHWPVAAALLASRGVLVLLLTRGARADVTERLAAVPGADEALVLDGLPIPAGVPSPTPTAAAWDDLLHRLGARPRGALD